MNEILVFIYPIIGIIGFLSQMPHLDKELIDCTQSERSLIVLLHVIVNILFWPLIWSGALFLKYFKL